MKFVVPVAKGGTGATTPSAAALNLGGIDIDQLNQPNGVAMVGPDGKLFAESIPSSAGGGATVLGASQLSVNQSSTYEITNFDSNTVYTVIAVKGVATLNGNTITYVAGPTAGTGGFSINGKSFAVSLIGNQSIRPTIVTPSNGAVNQPASVTFDSTAFNANGWNDIHNSSDWQLSTSATFNPLVTSVTASTTNKTSWTVSGLLPNTTYYVRVRHKGTNYNYSDWSVASTFATKTAFLASSEEAILSAPDKANNDRFGQCIAMSADGSRVVVGVPYATVGGVDYSGAVYVFVRSGSTWALEQKLSDSAKFQNAYFGVAVTISGNGTCIAVGSPYSSPGGVYRAGAVLVYERIANVWTQKANLSSSRLIAEAAFGAAVSMDDVGETLLIGAYKDTTNSNVSSGRCYIFDRHTGLWTQDDVFDQGSDQQEGNSFGYSVALSSDGNFAVVGAEFQVVSGIVGAGKAYICKRSAIWDVIASVQAPNLTVNGVFGYSVAMSGDGSRFVVGAKQSKEGGLNNAGAAYVYKRLGTTSQWVFETKLVQNVLATDDQFGFCVDITNDGESILVGSPYTNSNSLLNTGSASLFKRTDTTWNLSSKLVASVPGEYHNFGYSVAMAKDSTRVVVGANQAQPGGLIAPGAAYVFS